VSDVDARLVVGEQWLLDPEHVTATDEALGGGAHGVVRKGLLYGHVPVALKVCVFRCGLYVVVGVWLQTSRGRLGWEGTGGRAVGAGGVAPPFWSWPSLAGRPLLLQGFHALSNPDLYLMTPGSPTHRSYTRKVLEEAR
jgi:hypothetical protein